MTLSEEEEEEAESYRQVAVKYLVLLKMQALGVNASCDADKCAVPPRSTPSDCAGLHRQSQGQRQLLQAD